MKRAFAVAALSFVLAASVPLPPAHASAQQKAQADPQQTIEQQQDEDKAKRGKGGPWDTQKEIAAALARLPLATVLGAALALRPRRRGTPARQPAVIQTQIILAIVGAVVMMIVGTNLARAFGIVGAAGLVRYRAKIEDPKDAGVMLTTLAVGLAAGVGLYAMAVACAVFIMVVLYTLESFEPDTRKLFDLKIRMGDETDAKRGEFETILNRYHVDFELRSSSDTEVIYEVSVPLELQKDRISNALLTLDPEGHGAVEWADKKQKTK